MGESTNARVAANALRSARAPRREEMERLGWRVLVLYADDVLRRWPATTGRVMQAFADRGVDPGNLADAPDVVVRPRNVEVA